MVAASDTSLRAAFARAPEARVGRPALRAALLVTPSLARRLEEAGLGADLAAVRWIALAVAVGDGADLGLVAGAGGDRAAVDLLDLARRRLDTLRADPALAALGLASFAEDVRLGRKAAEAHLAFRLAARPLDRFLDGIARLSALLDRADRRDRRDAAPALVPPIVPPIAAPPAR